MSMYEIDSAYVRRCQKRLQEWGAPSPAGTVTIFTMWQMKRKIPTISNCSLANSAIVRKYDLFM